VALRTGIAPSELIAYPLVLAAIIEDLQAQDEDAAHVTLRDRLKRLTK
jgi:hypothetical protein